MGQQNLLENEENARLELYAEVQKGLRAIEDGKVKTADEVRLHMDKRRKKYLSEEF